MTPATASHHHPNWSPDLLREALLLMASPRLVLPQQPALLLPGRQRLLHAALLLHACQRGAVTARGAP